MGGYGNLVPKLCVLKYNVFVKHVDFHPMLYGRDGFVHNRIDDWGSLCWLCSVAFQFQFQF